MIVAPKVVDISHYNRVASFAALRAAGYCGVIHKCIQGAAGDPFYEARRGAATAAGLLWGGYAFSTGEEVKLQVQQFLTGLGNLTSLLVALDFEDNTASEMTLAQACEFLDRADQALGRPAWLYSGNRIKTLICDATDAQWDLLAARLFWLCEYGPVSRMIDDDGDDLPWVAPTLWQFTDGRNGPQPHSAPGITGLVDINSFAGTDEELTAAWPGVKPTPKPTGTEA